MKAEDNLVLALEFLTEGSRAQVPRRLSRELFSTADFRKDMDKLQKEARPWTQGRGIQGLGIGEKTRRGRVTKKLALRVYVDKKRPLSETKHRIPERVRIPRVGEFTTDVIEIGKVRPELFTSKVRPAMPGCGISLLHYNKGTFGCLVRGNKPKHGRGALYVLSNSHVLADYGIANVGDAVIQPAYIDYGNTSTDVIATAHAWVPFIYSATGYPNLVDAAIAKVCDKSLVDNRFRILGSPPTGVSTTLYRGMQVKKVGRTSDLTLGIVKDIHFRTALNYKHPGGSKGRVGFRDQVLCTDFTADGDSGSIVLNRRNRVVGLHFAGSISSSIFNRIEHVFEALDVSLA